MTFPKVVTTLDEDEEVKRDLRDWRRLRSVYWTNKTAQYSHEAGPCLEGLTWDERTSSFMLVLAVVGK